jgi:two-component system CheB/CheR fusion protein
VKPHSTSEERLKLAVEVAQFGIIELDYLNDSAVADDKAAELFGIPAGKKLSREEVHRRFHPEDVDEIERRVSESLKPDGPGEFTMQHRVMLDDDCVRWVNVRKRIFFEEVDGQLIAARGMVAAVDVTQQKLREQSIQSGEDRLRIAAETTGFGTYDISANGDQLVWSDQSHRIFGLEPGSTFTREMMFERLHREDRDHYRDLFQRLIQKGADENFQLEQRIVRPNGEIRWVINSGCVIAERGRSRPTRVVGTIQDITDRKLFEQSLKTAKEEAESANRSRGEFLANMSHEIRTPMAAIIGHADILREHLNDPDNVQVVETIRRNGHFLLGILNDILDLPKIDAGKLEVERQPVRPDALVAEVRSLMDVRAAEKKLPLRIEFDGKIPEVIQTDAIRMRQILVNLVGNAIKFTDQGEVKLTVRYDADSNRLMFQVADTGMGIEPDELGSLFDPFVQADNTSTRTIGGTGLGLAICQRLARALSGEVNVESEAGVGSTFTLSVEVAEEVCLVKPDLSLNIAAPLHDGEIELTVKVLVVDDRRDIRYLAQHFIERAGGEV